MGNPYAPSFQPPAGGPAGVPVPPPAQGGPAAQMQQMPVVPPIPQSPDAQASSSAEVGADGKAPAPRVAALSRNTQPKQGTTGFQQSDRRGGRPTGGGNTANGSPWADTQDSLPPSPEQNQVLPREGPPKNFALPPTRGPPPAIQVPGDSQSQQVGSPSQKGTGKEKKGGKDDKMKMKVPKNAWADVPVNDPVSPSGYIEGFGMTQEKGSWREKGKGRSTPTGSSKWQETAAPISEPPTSPQSKQKGARGKGKGGGGSTWTPKDSSAQPKPAIAPPVPLQQQQQRSQQKETYKEPEPESWQKGGGKKSKHQQKREKDMDDWLLQRFQGNLPEDMGDSSNKEEFEKRQAGKGASALRARKASAEAQEDEGKSKGGKGKKGGKGDSGGKQGKGKGKGRS